MPTPSSGAISMLDMRNEITRGGAAVDMGTVRALYGGSGAISFSDLYKTEAWVITSANTVAGKGVYTTGWGQSIGSISPGADANGHIQISTASFIGAITSLNTDGGPPNGNVAVSFDNDTNTLNAANVTLITSGWKPSDVTRLVFANTARTVTVSNNTASANYFMPNSGAVNFLIKL